MKKLPIGAWDPRNVVIGLLSLITAASVSATLIVIHREPEPLDFAPIETDAGAEHYDGGPTSAENPSSSLSLLYGGEVTVSLSDGTVTFLAGNPAASGYDLVFLIEVTDGEHEAVIGQTGRIPSGMQVRETSLVTEYASLSAGKYVGQIRVLVYDAETGARTQFDSLLKDIEITVTE